MERSHHLSVNAKGELCWAEVPIRGVHMHRDSRWFRDWTLVFTLA